MADHAAEIDPFAPGALDQETELAALTHALEFASGFRLLFALCNQAPQRRQLMAALRQQLPQFTIQEIHFREPVAHLLDALHERLIDPLPDVVFVSGLEHSLPDPANAATTPFIANLNASRNSFPPLAPRPLVLWAPEYVLAAIVQCAPDFFSIRSGVYAFAATPEELARFAYALSAGENWQAHNLLLAEKRDRVAAIERLLAEYETLPVEHRDRKAEVRLLYHLAVLQYTQGKYGEAIRHLQHSLNLAEKLGDRADLTNLLHMLGVLHQVRGEYSLSWLYYEQSLSIAEELGDSAGTAKPLHNIGTLYLDRGEYDEAQYYYEQSLQVREEFGDHAGIGRSLAQLGLLHQVRGEYATAQRRYEQSLRLAEELGDRAGFANTLGQFGTLYQVRGEYDAAQQRYEQSLRIMEELGDRAGGAASCGQIGALLTKTGHYEEAFPRLLSSLMTFQELQSPNAEITENNLRILRAQWGAQAFDSAWHAATNEDVPEWLLEMENAAA